MRVRKFQFTSVVLACATMTSLMGARPAAAQASDGAAPASQPASAPPAVAAPATDAADDQVQTVVVTASN